jgi:hypothetical protein
MVRAEASYGRRAPMRVDARQRSLVILLSASTTTQHCRRERKGACMSTTPDPGAFEFEKVSVADARKALDESGAGAYAVRRQPENWEAKRKDTPPETLSDATHAWLAELPEAVRPKQLALRYARLANRLCEVWGTRAKCERLLDDLMIDRRGGRKGFPLPVANELATLRDHYFRLHRGGPSAWEYVEMGR